MGFALLIRHRQRHRLKLKPVNYLVPMQLKKRMLGAMIGVSISADLKYKIQKVRRNFNKVIVLLPCFQQFYFDFLWVLLK